MSDLLMLRKSKHILILVWGWHGDYSKAYLEVSGTHDACCGYSSFAVANMFDDRLDSQSMWHGKGNYDWLRQGFQRPKLIEIVF